MPFVNNYGVWEDEFRELGLEHTLNATWKDALCYFGEGQEVRMLHVHSCGLTRLHPGCPPQQMETSAPAVRMPPVRQVNTTALLQGIPAVFAGADRQAVWASVPA